MYSGFVLKRLREGGGFTQARFNKLTSYRYLKLGYIFNALSPLEEFAGVRSYLTNARSFFSFKRGNRLLPRREKRKTDH